MMNHNRFNITKKDNFKIIDFCNFKTSVVNTDIIKSSILEKIGPLITYEKLKVLNNTDITNSLVPLFYRFRTNGIKVYLYFTNNNGKYYSYIIEQNSPNKIEIISCRLRVSPELYTGTLFSGELAFTKQKNWELLITDCLLFKNEKIQGPTEFIKNFDLSKYYQSDKIIQYLELSLYPYQEFKELSDITYTNIVKSRLCYIGIELLLNNNTKRIIYFDNFDNMLISGLNKQDSKNIPFQSKKETFQDFFIISSKRPDIYYLFENEKDANIVKNNIPYIKELELSLDLRKRLGNSDKYIRCNCMMNKKFNKWQVVKLY